MHNVLVQRALVAQVKDERGVGKNAELLGILVCNLRSGFP